MTQASLSAAELTTPVDSARLRNLFHSFVSGLSHSMKWIASRGDESLVAGMKMERYKERH